MIEFSNLKLQKKLIEMIEEQTDLHIPIKYKAVYFKPIENEYLSKI